jgi:hypothetical protein
VLPVSAPGKPLIYKALSRLKESSYVGSMAVPIIKSNIFSRD